MKKEVLIILLFFGSYNIFTQESIQAILDQKFPAHELKSDLAFIKNKAVFKKYHYTGLVYAGKERFQQLYDSIENVIEQRKEMNRVEFYLLTAPLIKLLQDDCSFYSLMGEYTYDNQNRKYLLFSDKFIVPLEFKIFKDSVYINNYGSELFESKILSINNIPIGEIVSSIYKYTSSSKFRYYDTHQNGSLNLYDYPVLGNVLFGFENEVQITYSSPGENIIQTKTLELMPLGSPKSSYLNQDKRKPEWYSLSFEKEIAVLRIESSPRGTLDLDEINSVFEEIQTQKASKLVIDISDCYWSNDNFWLLILNYLAEGKLWLYQYHKEEKDLAGYTRKKIKNSDYISGKYSSLNKDFRFTGNIYLITGAQTGSSAVKFADILKFNKITDEVFGSETLVKATQYDYVTTHYLPFTGLKLKISVSMSYALDKNLDMHGLIPDREVEPENQKEFLRNKDNQVVIQKVIGILESE